ncbi:MAG: ATP-grasp domain-containing protein [Acidobacteriota bacterium]|nr:ATP-grasp domain-containing protein [Blastocatellia bacterium]MDW8413235.1 ATP-grasp domain-containing protein [Acidobacteriota bacterium]
MKTVLCLASLIAGSEFMRELHRLGHKVYLLTKEKSLNEDWPRECIEEVLALPNETEMALYVTAACHIAASQKIDLVVALHEFDVLAAAMIREHMHLPGMGLSQVRLFRDKLSMRIAAKNAGLSVPSFSPVINRDEIKHFLSSTTPPWMLKPRQSAGGIGIKKLTSEEALWQRLGELEQRQYLHERPSYHLLETYIEGEVYHVDTLLRRGRIRFVSASKYRRPPFEIYAGGGIYSSHTLLHGSEEEKELLEMNSRLLKAFGLKQGPAHAEFIRDRDGKLYFLEVAARIGGAHIAETIEAAYGVNPWIEWARIEIDADTKLKKLRNHHAGVIISLARYEWPDTSSFTDSEIYYRVKKKNHIGFVVSSPSYDRVIELLEDYEKRIREDYNAVAPPLERPEEL